MTDDQPQSPLFSPHNPHSHPHAQRQFQDLRLVDRYNEVVMEATAEFLAQSIQLKADKEAFIEYIEREYEALRTTALKVRKATEELERREAQARECSGNWDDVIELDVGGQMFNTRRGTLVRFPDSMLASMFSGRHTLALTKAGRVFIDRDPRYFAAILACLRSGRPGWPLHFTSPTDRARFIEELDFFGLTEAWAASTTFKSGLPSRNPMRNFGIRIQHAIDWMGCENTAESLTDGNFHTGVCFCLGGPLTLIFPEKVTLSRVEMAGYFKPPKASSSSNSREMEGGVGGRRQSPERTWSPSTGVGAVIEFFDGLQWEPVATVPTSFGQAQELTVLSWAPQTASMWRVIHPKDFAFGASHMLFRE